MSDIGLLLGPHGLRVLAGVGIGAGLLWLYRWVRARFLIGARIFAAGLLLRAFLGLALFWISWLDLPFLSAQHRGDGFWWFAPDASTYMREATLAAEQGLEVVSAGGLSPGYVKVVALWMRLVGISPASGMYLNLVLYSLTCAVLVALWQPKNERRSDLPLLVLLTAFAFSPVQVLHGTHMLKDEFFAFLIVLAAASGLVLLVAVVNGFRAVQPRWAAGAAAIWPVSLYLAAGLRAYFAFFMLCCLTAALAVFSLRPRWDTLYWRLPLIAALCLSSTWPYAVGAGPYDRYLSTILSVLRSVSVTDEAGGVAQGAGDDGIASLDAQNTGLVSLALRSIERARLGFALSGGETNLVSAQIEAPSLAGASPGPDGGRGTGGDDNPSAGRSRQSASGPADRVRRPRPQDDPLWVEAVVRTAAAGTWISQLAVGLATLVVPISLLQALSVTNLITRQIELWVTNIDTLFVDLTVLATGVLLVRRWKVARRRLPYVCFLLLLSGATALLLAYVVTNFGTQFRLRMLAVVPFWLLLLATSESPFIPPRAEEPSVFAPAPRGTSG